MTVKQLEKKIAELEAKIADLQSQLLTLSLRQPVVVPNTLPPAYYPTITVPNINPWPPYTPYIGDVPCGNTSITCGSHGIAQ